MQKHCTKIYFPYCWHIFCIFVAHLLRIVCMCFACMFLVYVFAQNVFLSAFWTCFFACFFGGNLDQYPGLGLPLNTGPLALQPFGQGFRDWELLCRAREMSETYGFRHYLYWVCRASLFSHVDPCGQIAPSTLSFIRARDFFAYKQTSIDNCVAAEGQSPDAGFVILRSHPGGRPSAPPTCPPSCLLRLLRSCHLCKPSFLAKLKRNCAKNLARQTLWRKSSGSLIVPALGLWTSLYITHPTNVYVLMCVCGPSQKK